MFEFIIYILLASLVGIQFGLYLLLRQNKIPIGQSLLFSFAIFVIPIIITVAHIEIFKKRHLLVQVLAKKKKLNTKEIEAFSSLLDTKKFMVFSFLLAIKDLVTPKDNIILIVTIAELYNKKYAKQHNKQSLLERIGLIGLLKMATGVVRKYFVSHASDQMYLNDFRVKHL